MKAWSKVGMTVPGRTRDEAAEASKYTSLALSYMTENFVSATEERRDDCLQPALR